MSEPPPCEPYEVGTVIRKRIAELTETAQRRGRQLGMRWQDPMLIAIDSWREQHDVATRPEAIRRLVELGLKVKTK